MCGNVFKLFLSDSVLDTYCKQYVCLRLLWFSLRLQILYWRMKSLTKDSVCSIFSIFLFHFIDLFIQVPFRKSTVYFQKSAEAESINNNIKNQFDKMTCQWHRSGFLLLTLNIFNTFIKCLYFWLSISKY